MEDLALSSHLFKERNFSNTDLVAVFFISLFIWAIYTYPGVSYQGDAASTVEIIDHYTDMQELENVSFAGLFRGDSPFYPTIMGLYKKIGISLDAMTIMVNGIFFILMSFVVYFTISFLVLDKTRIYIFWLMWLLNFSIMKYYTAPISFSYHALWTAFVFFFILGVENNKLSLNLKTLSLLILFAGIGMITNYASFTYILFLGLYLIYKKNILYVFLYGFLTPLPFLYTILQGELGVSSYVITGSILGYPYLKTAYFVIRGVFPFFENFYFISLILFLLSSYFVYKERLRKNVILLILAIFYFFFMSYLFNLFIDKGAVINYKRAINVALPIFMLFVYVINSNWFRLKKVYLFLCVPYLIVSFVLYQQQVYSKGPRFNEYELQKSKVVSIARELLLSESIIYTNNSPTTYMLFRKRLPRVPLVNGTDTLDSKSEQTTINEMKNNVASSQKVYYLELLDNDGNYMTKDRLKQFLNVRELKAEKGIVLYKLELK